MMSDWQASRDEWLNSRPEAKREYDRLGPTYDIISDVYGLLNLRDIDYLELAAKMGKTRAVISRLLFGNANPSLAFLQELAEALDAKLTIHLEPKEQAEGVGDRKPGQTKRTKKDSQVA